MNTHSRRRDPHCSKRASRRPSAALVVACLALGVSLGGTSYAAFVLPANSVGPPQLRPHAVTRGKLAPAAVDSRALAARAVTARTLAPGAVTLGSIRNGVVTAPKLARGAITSAAVPAGAGVVVTYRYGTIPMAPGAAFPAYVACPLGTTVTGGGATADQPSVTINDSAPFNRAANAFTSGASDSWGVYATNTDAVANHTLAIYAVCIVTRK